MSGGAFILKNLLAQPYVALSASGTTPAGLSASNLATEEPTEISRILSLHPSKTSWVADSEILPLSFDAAALVNTNLSPHGYYRFYVGNVASAFSVLTPDGLSSSTNVTGLVTAIDEVTDSPDGSYIGPTNPALQWATTISFGASGGIPVYTGAAMVQFVLIVKLFGAPVLTYPKITIQLYEGGSLVQSLGWKAVTVASGNQTFIFPFDPALLADITLANVQCRIIGDPGDGSSYFKLDAIEAFYDDSSANDGDTFWLPAFFDTFADNDTPQPTKSLAAWYEETITGAVGVVVSLLDDQAQLNPPLTPGVQGVNVSAVTRLPYGYVDAGVFVAGPALYLSVGPLYGSPSFQSPIIAEQLGGATVGGQTYGADAFRRRTLAVELVVTRDELNTLKDRIAWRRGHAGAFYFAAEPEIPIEQQMFNSGWWTLQSMSGESQLPMAYDGGDGSLLYAVTIELEEKL